MDEMFEDKTILVLIIILITIALYFFCLLLNEKIKENNANKYSAISTVMAALVGIFALFFIGYQTLQLRKSVNLQRQEFALEHRPYLYLNIPADKLTLCNPITIDGCDAWFGGGPLYFRNIGKDPATIITTQYMIASDTSGEIKLVEWLNEEFGGFQDIKVVFPDQEDQSVMLRAMIAPKNTPPKLLFIGAVISYIGSNPTKKYWYMFNRLVVIVPGNEEPYVLHSTDQDWDKNTNSEAPELKEPDWDYYLSRSYIKSLTGR